MIDLVVDSANLYALDFDDFPDSLYRIPLTGGYAERIVHASKSGILDFAVQAGVLYYTVGNEVKSVPADATDATGTVVAVASAAASGYLYGVAVDGSLLFWSAGQSASNNVEGDLISGGNRRTLGATQGSHLRPGQPDHGWHARLLGRTAPPFNAESTTLPRRKRPSQARMALKSPPSQSTPPPRTSHRATLTAPKPVGRLEKATFGAKARGDRAAPRCDPFAGRRRERRLLEERKHKSCVLTSRHLALPPSRHLDHKVRSGRDALDLLPTLS